MSIIISTKDCFQLIFTQILILSEYIHKKKIITIIIYALKKI